MDEKHFVFPHHLFHKGDRIVIYGAGKVGREFYNQALLVQYVNVVQIVDTNYENLNTEDFPIQSINILNNIHYDYILIAVKDAQVKEEIKSELISFGVEPQRIKWDGENYSFYDYYKSFFFPHRDIDFTKMERLPNKKTILVIDWQVPQYDTNAGDRTRFQYLCFFVELGLRTIYVASTYIDWEKYTKELRDFGVEVLVGGEWDFRNFERWIELNGDVIDYVYLNREEIFDTYIDLIQHNTNSKVFFYPHDFAFVRLEREFQITHNKALLQQAEKSKELSRKILNKADVIHVLGTYEKEIAHAMAPSRQVTTIPVYLYDEKELRELKPLTLKRRNDLIFVGGYQHRPNVDAMLWFVKDIWPIISERLPRSVLYIVGSNPPADIQQLANEKIIVTGYVTDDELKQLYANAAVSVVPLRYGAGQKGKVIEAMYMGVPLVCTGIAAEGFVDIEKYVDIADTSADFAERVIDLFKVESYWNKRSIKLRNYLMKYLTKECAKKILMQDMDI